MATPVFVDTGAHYALADVQIPTMQKPYDCCNRLSASGMLS